MQQIAFQLADAEMGGDVDGLVDGGRSVLTGPTIEQADDPIGIPAPMPDRSAGKMIQPVDDPGIGRPLITGRQDGCSQFWTEGFIRIHDQDMIMPCVIHRKLLLVAKSQEGLLEDPGTKGFGDRHRPIRRTGVDDQDLLDDVPRTGQTGSEVLFSIQGDDDQGKRRHTANLRWGGG